MSSVVPQKLCNKDKLRALERTQNNTEKLEQLLQDEINNLRLATTPGQPPLPLSRDTKQITENLKKKRDELNTEIDAIKTQCPNLESQLNEDKIKECPTKDLKAQIVKLQRSMELKGKLLQNKTDEITKLRNNLKKNCGPSKQNKKSPPKSERKYLTAFRRNPEYESNPANRSYVYRSKNGPEKSSESMASEVSEFYGVGAPNPPPQESYPVTTSGTYNQPKAPVNVLEMREQFEQKQKPTEQVTLIGKKRRTMKKNKNKKSVKKNKNNRKATMKKRIRKKPKSNKKKTKQ